jgi:endonuclease G, mitochondrial
MISIDPDYKDRKGYSPSFLGIDVPLPELSTAARAKAVEVAGTRGQKAHELKYHHFSVVMNREARLAYFAAVNYDASAKFRHARHGADRWVRDPRIEAALQAGDEFYTDNPLDRGHLVRRADAGWGGSAEEAARASDDTFHLTNCTPQHEIFNQAAKAKQEDLLLWGNIESHIATCASDEGGRLSIFNGPVFRSSDRSHRGLQIPKEFWKIVIYKSPGRRLVAVGFVLSQEGLIEDLPFEQFAIGPYRPFQVKIQRIEAKTKLDFGPLRSADALEKRTFESAATSMVLTSLDDIVTG